MERDPFSTQAARQSPGGDAERARHRETQPVSPRLNQRLAFATVLAIVLCLGGCRLLHSNGVTIQAVNSSTQFIRAIEVDFPGGSFGIAALRPGGTRSRWARMTASGSLKIIFVDDS